MITLRRAQQRYDNRRGKEAAWLTFYAQAADDELANGFGTLEALDEIRIAHSTTVKASTPRCPETVTYVVTGTLAYEGLLGHWGILRAGEFRCVAVPAGVQHGAANASLSDSTHLFQIGLQAKGAHDPSEEQRRFSTADRQDRLCLVAAADTYGEALRLHQDASVYSALLHSGQHLVHELRSERRAWLHVVSGEVALNDLILTGGDGAGVSAERAVAFTARAPAEILLIDVA